jgi:hypothetical protein
VQSLVEQFAIKTGRPQYFHQPENADLFVTRGWLFLSKLDLSVPVDATVMLRKKVHSPTSLG